MNNKTAIYTYLATVKSANKMNRNRIMDIESVLMVVRWEEMWGN